MPSERSPVVFCAKNGQCLWRSTRNIVRAVIDSDIVDTTLIPRYGLSCFAISLVEKVHLCCGVLAREGSVPFTSGVCPRQCGVSSNSACSQLLELPVNYSRKPGVMTTRPLLLTGLLCTVWMLRDSNSYLPSTSQITGTFVDVTKASRKMKNSCKNKLSTKVPSHVHPTT